MREIVKTNIELCTGCNRCVRGCPMELANVTYQDEDGNIKVKVDHTRCIACGRCIEACRHNARYFEDDTELFFNDLSKGVPISLISAPSIRTNIPEWKKLFTFLKKSGVKKIYDISLGADICIWGYVKYIQQNNPVSMITQPCPAIVSYCEMFNHDLLKYLSPVQSPAACVTIYMREYEGIDDRIAAITPCVAKAHEFEALGAPHYSVTFARICNYLKERGIELPDEETGFDHSDCGLGALFPTPGGLKENIEFFLGDSHRILKGEGFSVYEKLNAYAKTPESQLPEIFDVLNCIEGCNVGPACSHSCNVFEIDSKMKSVKGAALGGRDRKYFETLYDEYDKKFDLSHFLRTYHKVETNIPDITDADIQRAFELMNKTDHEKQNVDCRACGSDTCYDMARKIALGVNIPVNCMVNTMNTAKEEHENKLNTLEELEMIWGHVESGIAIIDSNTRLILDVNPAAVRMYGADREEMIGKICYNFFGQHECPIIDLDMALDRTERSFKKANGSIIPILKSVSKIYYNGRPALLESFTDISPLKEAEETNRMLEVAEQANKAKSAFLANMSHEIRTPMNAILGIAEIQLQGEDLEPGMREALNKIYNSGDLLLGIINDILDMSKIEAGKMELTVDNYDTASLINDTVQLNMMRIGSKPIEFELLVDADTPSNLYGDELRIKQILNNLLSNAFKYTAEGTVRLEISSENSEISDADKTTLVLRVTDTGQGMTKAQVDKLFEEYSRFNMQANRMTEGTGLGMSITQNLIRMMDGRISVESVPDKGSTFTVYLPQGRVGSGVLGKELAENLRQFRKNSRAQMKRVQISREPMPYGSVLIVDDVETNIYVAKGLLAPYGLNVDSADSGFAAIKKVEQGNAYDIIFMDHMMPKMDGMEATRIIREKGYSRPIVALTANAVIGQAEMFLTNGFDDFISKPIDIRQMNNVLNKLIRDKYPPEVVEEARRRAESAAEGPDKAGQAAPEVKKAAIDPRFAEIFARDANKALAVLDAIQAKPDKYSEDDMRMYIINVHGMKGALANIGETELSGVARNLEKAGREGDIAVISSDTPAFLSSLREFIKGLVPEEKDEPEEAAGGDIAYLNEKLLEIKAACEIFDKKAAKNTIAELREKPWPRQTQEFLSGIAEHLLHSDFDEAASAVNEFLGETKS